MFRRSHAHLHPNRSGPNWLARTVNRVEQVIKSIRRKSRIHGKRRGLPPLNDSRPIIPPSVTSIPLFTSHLPPLPTEVWEKVIDWLASSYNLELGRTWQRDLDFRRDLSSCTLVCHAWKIRAQMHLFVSLRVLANGLSHYEALIRKSPILCSLAKELHFYNEYRDEPKDEIEDKTVETATHIIRIAHKLPKLQFLHMQDINLAIEHPNFPRYIAALRNLNRLEFYSRTPTKLSPLVHMLVGLRSLSILYLSVDIIVESPPPTLPTSCYSPKSSLTKLVLPILPGGHLLTDWLVHTIVYTTSL